MNLSPDIRLLEIRAHEGSQARAWEELAYQLRPAPGPGHVETRKTRAPDGGVEWYDVYADGHEEGFQAKFNPDLQSALGGMRESVDAVCPKRPRMTKLTFVVPYDFTDTGESPRKSDQNRWDDAVKGWRERVPRAEEVQFSVIRAGEIVDKLSLHEHAGRRAYWFGNLELTDDWFQRRWSESRVVAGERYTPEADTPTVAHRVIAATAMSDVFQEDVRRLIDRTLTASRHDAGMWGAHGSEVDSILEDLVASRDRSLGRREGPGTEIASGVPDFPTLAELASRLVAHASAALEAVPHQHETTNLNAARNAARDLADLADGRLAAFASARAVAVVGEAGQGKTHALLHMARGLLDTGTPALVVMGQRLSDATWWSAISDALGGIATDADTFLQALDSLAASRGRRAGIFIDALNESRSPRRWQQELPALVEQLQRYPNIALIVSFRSDYKDVVGVPPTLPTFRHPGVAGHEADALEAYCTLFKIPVPAQSLFDRAFSNPLFLRMYCAVLAAETDTPASAPTRSNLFERFVAVRSRQVAATLRLNPSSQVARDALELVANRLLANNARPVRRDAIENDVDALLPGRPWPDTLFHQMLSAGLLETYPTRDGAELVGFPFQAYSEHLLAARLLDLAEAQGPRLPRWLKGALHRRLQRRRIARTLEAAPWSWRAMGVLLPERLGMELSDFPPVDGDYRHQQAVRDGLTDRAVGAFTERALQLLSRELDTYSEEGIETVLTLAPRAGHPGNADWLHYQLVSLPMPDRDAGWSIATYWINENSAAYQRITRWAERLSPQTSDAEVRLASIALMWLLTSPNRFLRDRSSKTLATMLSKRLEVASALLRVARDVDDEYVKERFLTVTYGAIMIGGDEDKSGASSVVRALLEWLKEGLPVHVLARDSARGIAAWAHSRSLVTADDLARFAPPYGSAKPEEPPTKSELESRYGLVEHANGENEWRAFSILSSCLTWYGDFNKYVVKSDVEHFSLHPLPGPPPGPSRHDDPLAKVHVDWAGRWIAHRAISLGWTPERFEEFERGTDLHRGREGHKAERFGKKYQWIAHHELMARLADNYHPAIQPWNTESVEYHGPWEWYGRDFDPTLPPSELLGDSQVCTIEREPTALWAALATPAMDVTMHVSDWVAMTEDLPHAGTMFAVKDPDNRDWIALHRYATWSRANAQRRGISKRERDIFFLQFAWLTPRGQGRALHELLEDRGLAGRWMTDAKKEHTRYLGEATWAPIASCSESPGDEPLPRELQDAGLTAEPAVEQFVWEGVTLDCSLDENVDFYTLTDRLLGDASWVGHRAEWASDGRVVVRALKVPDGEGEQDLLLVESGWLQKRLDELNAEVVIATLSERHVLPLDDDHRRIISSDIWYVASMGPEGAIRTTGPLTRRGRAE